MAEERSLTPLGVLDVVVVTPKGEVTHRAASSVTARGALGEFGVLPGHIPFLTMLETGVLILEGRGGRQVWAHGPGYLEIGAGGRVEILVEQAAKADAIETGAVTAELEAIEKEVKEFQSTAGADWRNLSARRNWAIARLEAHARGRA